MHAPHPLPAFWSRLLAVALTVGLSVLAIFMLFGAMVLAIVLAAGAVLVNLVRGRRIAPVDLRWRSAAGARSSGRATGGEVVDVTVREIDAGSSHPSR
jgi:hypothetical protein